MKKFLLFLLFSVFIFKISISQTSEKYKAVHIYRITQNINWRLNSQPEKYIITVIGNSPINWELNNVSKSARATKPRIEIKKVSSVSKIGYTHIVYIPKTKSSMINDIVQKLEGQKTIIISDNVVIRSNGIDINLSYIENTLKLEINKNNIEQKGLKINEAIIANNLPYN
ncbi:MAG: DUF4154 domain-containing protein [Bacteroidales bacterium]|nr:DUF4154 domain-containing protein [Bacteroidales bacterium]